MKLRISLTALYYGMGFKGNTIPPDFGGTFVDMPVWEHMSNMKGGHQPKAVLTIKVYPTNNTPKGSTRRVYVLCPQCKTEIPFGNISAHMGTKRCDLLAMEHDSEQGADNFVEMR